ncbi:hypothetical protein AX14_013161 [Amanita brunnescens Koide BX004]|nr:hypothetical protein AX14_013161 [Amanita brunnescens Koide BX004]
MLSPLEGYIIAMTTQAFLLGVYLASFLLCLRWLTFSDDGGNLRKGINWPFLIIAIVIFAFSVTDSAIYLQSIIWVSEGRSPTMYMTIINFSIEMLTPIITDGVLIFRCWTVYDKSWRIIILPLLLLLYNTSLLIIAVLFTTHISGIDQRFINYGMLSSYYASTIMINIFATSVIILKIKRNSLSRRLSHFAIRVIAESGLLYTLASIVFFCALLTAISTNFVFHSVSNAISFPTSGIAYNLILIRVAKNRVNSEHELPTIIGASTIERAIPAVPRSQPETVTS